MSLVFLYSTEGKIQLKERFKVDKKNCDFENGEIEFGVELCTNDGHITVKVFELY